MKKIFLFLFTVLFSGYVYSQKTTELLAQAKQQEQARNEMGALDKYKQVLLIDRNNVEALCGASFMCSRCGNREATKEKKIAMFNTAKTFAMQAIKLNPNSSFANYVMAVAMGRMALISGSKDKVAASRDIKKYADKAAQLDPKFAGNWHVIGKYNYAMSNLNFAEKAAANLLFGGLPSGDINTAIANFEKCRAIDPLYIANLYDLAVAYKENKNVAKAKEILNIAINAPLRIQDDEEHKNNCRKLLKTLN